MPERWDFIRQPVKAFFTLKNAASNKKIDTTGDNNNNNDNNNSRDDDNQLLSSTVTKYSPEKEGQQKQQPQPPLQKIIGFASDIGLNRSKDEDSILITDLMTAFEGKKRRKVILILADGMGGYNKGEVASKLGTRTVATELQQFLADADMNKEKYDDLLRKAFYKANSEILEYTETHPEAQGMGTTISVAIINDNQGLYIGSVGDSRVYIINREKGAIQLTKDHTFVQELVDKGKITKEEARRHPKKSVLNQAVGSFAEITVDTFSRCLDDNDYILLCCDGLINHISDDEIAQIVLDNVANPQVACDKLVACANERGGKDNISVIIAPANIMKS
jgi:serine/threonine protein phosphatase PrpC